MNIDEASILITGGAGALGTSFTFDLASRGARVLVCDLSEEALNKVKQTAEQKKLSVETFQADVCQENDVENLFNWCVGKFGKIDVLINNAGIAEDGLLVKKKGDEFEKFPFSRWQRGLAVNLNGTFLCGREAAFHMVKQGSGGIIINISSISRHGNFIQSNYSATKAALIALTVVWSKELSRHGIRTMALAPGYIDSPLTRNIPKDIIERDIIPKIPLRRLGQIDEVAHAIRFVIENDYFNGRVIDLDGGIRF